MLGLDNPIHLLFLLAILLLVFGAKRLPEIGSSLGAGLRGFKDSVTAGSTQVSHAEQAPTTLRVAPAATSQPVTEAAAASTSDRPAA